MKLQPDRRLTPRVIATLEVNVRVDLSLLDVEIARTDHFPLSLMGRTYDLSARGLSVGLPSVRADKRFPTGQNPRAEVSVITPSGLVEIEASAMYVLAPGERDCSHGSIVGLRIDGISESHQKLLRGYLSAIS
jgi:hypothetical protein